MAGRKLLAVIFDLDGVLCETDEFHYQSWKAAVAPYKIPFSRSLNDYLRGLDRRSSLEIILGEASFSNADKQRILDAKNDCYLDLINHLSRENLLPGVDALLEDLTAQAVLIGVASASQHVDAVLAGLGIAGLVQATCRGNQLALTKPAPDPYLFTAARLGVSPSESLVVEDSAAGVQAGVAAGMCVLGIGPEDRLEKAFRVVPNLDGITVNALRAIHREWLADDMNVISPKT